MDPAVVRKIIHVDMDAFFALVEQRDDPVLRRRPPRTGIRLVGVTVSNFSKAATDTGAMIHGRVSVVRWLFFGQGAVLSTAARRRPFSLHYRVVIRIGATAPNGVVVAKGDDDLPPHNALRFCHSTPEVNGFALFPPRRANALRSGDCRGPRCGQNGGRCAWGARHSQGMFQ